MSTKRLQIIFFIILQILCISCFVTGCTSPHIQINTEEISRVIIYDSMYESTKFHTLSQSEQADLVKWFNECKDIRLNSEFAGTVSIVGIIIEMKDNRKISIINSGNDFEIQVYYPEKHQSVSYWAKQENIKTLLKSLDKENN